MLLSIKSARSILPSIEVLIAGNTIFSSGVFLFPLFQGHVSNKYLFIAIAVLFLWGLGTGLFLKYRSVFEINSALIIFADVFFAVELLFAGGVAAAAVSIAGQSELRWYAVATSSFCMMMSLMAGMYVEATTLGYWNIDDGRSWRENMNKYVDYSKYQILPISSQPQNDREKRLQSVGFAVVAIGSANIPLLFQMYLGGSDNAIFLVVPVLTCTLAYVNFKSFGPGLLRLLLLKKIEKLHDRKFVNADLEQIQELRRTFFLSRWLMKDYVKPTNNRTAANDALQRK
jgi:hypothetical protein